MKIRFQKNKLIEAVGYALSSVSTKNTIPSIQGLLFVTLGNDKCVISSFDLEKGTRIILDAEIIEGGNCIINAQRFAQIIKMMPDSTVELTLNGDVACVESGKSQFEVWTMPGTEFPSFPELESEYAFTLKQKTLSKMVSQTHYAVSLNNQRVVFTGALFDIDSNKITVVGCDGYRLAVKKTICEMTDAYEGLRRKVIIPGKTLAELMRLIGDNDKDVTVKLLNKHIIFEIKEKNLVFFSRIIDGEYVDYERLIPKSFNTYVVADTDMLISAFERASLVSEENTASGAKSYVKLSVKDQMVEISSISANGKVRDEVSAEKDGDDIEIGFSCRYLLDCLRACKCEKVRLSLASPLISMLVEPAEEIENEKLTMLVLPIKLR